MEGNQQVATKPDESLSPSLFTFVRILPRFIAISTFLRHSISSEFAGGRSSLSRDVADCAGG
jgi:hypothetical protein